MKLPTKHKSLFLYGYALPFLGAGLFAAFPATINAHIYLNIASAFQENISLSIGVIALFVTITVPFQVKIVAEDSKVILQVLEGTEIRKVYRDALFFQSILIITLAITLLLSSTIFSHNIWVGFIMLFSASLIAFESIAMISNGRSYANIREKILIKTSLANKTLNRSR